MRNIFHCFLLALFLGVSVPALAAQDTETMTPQERLEARRAHAGSMADMTLSILQDQKKSFSERESTLERGITTMVDIDWIARFVLGNAWKSASEEQRDRYTELYQAYLTKMYISRFAQNPQRKISDMKVLGIADSQEDRYMARTEIRLSTAEKLRVDYLVSEKNGKNKIIDIIIEGMSLITTHRAEFSKIASVQGVEGVIHTLDRHISDIGTDR